MLLCPWSAASIRAVLLLPTFVSFLSSSWSSSSFSLSSGMVSLFLMLSSGGFSFFLEIYFIIAWCPKQHTIIMNSCDRQFRLILCYNNIEHTFDPAIILTSAPALVKSFTAADWPLRAAIINGVHAFVTSFQSFSLYDIIPCYFHFKSKSTYTQKN